MRCIWPAPKPLSKSRRLSDECPKVKIDQFCAGILKQRMEDGLLHPAEIDANVAEFDASQSCAVGCGGGFPCQAHL